MLRLMGIEPVWAGSPPVARPGQRQRGAVGLAARQASRVGGQRQRRRVATADVPPAASSVSQGWSLVAVQFSVPLPALLMLTWAVCAWRCASGHLPADLARPGGQRWPRQLRSSSTITVTLALADLADAVRCAERDHVVAHRQAVQREQRPGSQASCPARSSRPARPRRRCHPGRRRPCR